MRVLVTGATGFIGSSLTRRLLAEGNSVGILVRSAARAAPLVDAGAQPFVGDITDRAVLSAALEGVDIVYHTVGRLHAPEVPEAEYYRTHVEGTCALLDCCSEQPGLSRLVYLSTTGVLGVTGDHPADESAPVAPTNAYESSKWQAELQARRALNGGLPLVIVRPGMVYGPGDLHMLGFYRTIQKGLFRPIGRRPVWLSVIYIDDMLDALICCGHHPAATGECFHIAHPEPVTLRTLSAEIAGALSTRAAQGTIPLAAANLAAALGDLLPARLKPLAPLTRGRLDFLTHSRVYDVAKVRQTLGFVAQTELSAGITRTVTWYREQGYLPSPH